MRSDAWLFTTVRAGHKGELIYRGLTLSFTDGSGDEIFRGDRHELQFAFPWYLRNEGFRVRSGSEQFSIFMSDPRVTTPGDVGRRAYLRWRELFATDG